MKYKPKYQSRFKKHYQNMIRAGRYTETEFKTIADQLLNGDDHVIKAKKSERALFIKGNWLLIYTIVGDTVKFLDTGRHGEI